MSRAIVYPHLAHVARRGAAVEGLEPAAVDSYLDRLGKHVPGEALSVFLLVTGLSDVSTAMTAVALVVVALGAVLYRRNRDAQLPTRLRAKGVIYDVFTVVAFLAWAVGTSPQTQDILNVGRSDGVAVMALVAFLLPALDDAIGRRLGRN